MIEHLDGIHETVTYKENSSLRLFVNTDCEDYPIHWHTPMEIIMPLEGTYTVFLGDKHILLQEGDIIFICPGVLHSLAAPESGKRIILQIEWSVVSKIRDLNSILSLISPILTLTPQTAPDIYSDIYHLICQILSEYEKDSFLSEAVIYARMLDILSLIGRYQAFASCRFDAGPQKQKEYLDRFLSICNYIDEHCTEDLSLDHVAKTAGFSKYHFTRLFKQFTNTTYYKYLNRKRIDHAMLLLSDPDIPVTEAALQSGFSSLSTFFASSVLSNNVRLRNSAICIFIRKNCRKIPNSCCFRFCSFDTRYNTKNFLFLLFCDFHPQMILMILVKNQTCCFRFKAIAFLP